MIRPIIFFVWDYEIIAVQIKVKTLFILTADLKISAFKHVLPTDQYIIDMCIEASKLENVVL